MVRPPSVHAVSPLASLEDFRQRWEEAGVRHFVTENMGRIHLSLLVVPKERRKQGVGSRFMTDLTEYADNTQQVMTLSPATDFGASSVSRLKKFYGRFGFHHNRGSHKDYRFNESMVRQTTPLNAGRTKLGSPDI